MLKNKFLLFFIIFISTFYSCKKEGPGGKSSIDATAKHHERVIPHAKIYIKYGAREFPGPDPSNYDEVKTTGNITHAHTHFTELQRGDYYLYSTGFDSTSNEFVKGGIALKLKKDEHKEIIVPITE